MITELEFKSLASQGYNRIPLMADVDAVEHADRDVERTGRPRVEAAQGSHARERMWSCA